MTRWLLVGGLLVAILTGSVTGDPVPAEDPIGWTVVDEATGLRWRIEEIPRVEGTYRWIDDSTIRLRGGLHFEVVDYDETTFRVKVWRSDRRDPEPSSAGSAPTEIGGIEQSYRTDLGSSDRIVLQAFDHGLPKSGQWREGVDVVDLDADGRMDIVSGPPRKSTPARPRVFFGDGQGSWTPGRDTVFPDAPWDYGDVAAGDLDGDGDVDLAFAVHLRGLVVLRQEEPGVFVRWEPSAEPEALSVAFPSRAIELLDWDGDGRPELVALGEGPMALRGRGKVVEEARGPRVFATDSLGHWKEVPVLDDGGLAVQFANDFSLGDLDDDGDADVLVASHQRGNDALLGLLDPKGVWRSTPLPQLRPGSLYGAVTTGRGGRAPSFFVGFQSQEADGVVRTGIDRYDRNSRDGSWSRQSVYAVEGRRGVGALDTGDLDGDGNEDLVALTGDGEVWVLLGLETGGFVREASPELPAAAAGCRGTSVRIVDLGGDGRPELLATWAGEPGGLIPIAGLEEPGCLAGGSLRVWSVGSERLDSELVDEK